MRDFDYSTASEWLATFFEGTEHAVEIRALPNEHGAGRAAPLFGRDPGLIEAHCTRWDALDRAVFFGVCTRLTGAPSGARQDLAELIALWVDIDTGKLGLDKAAVVAALMAMPMPPSRIVDSGGGIHAYWLLKEPIDVRQGVISPDDEEAIVAVLRQLAGITAGDTAVCDLARVMRLPGTHNTKTGELRPVEVLEATDGRYEFSDLQDMLDTQRPVIIRPRNPAEKNPAEFTAEKDPFLAAAERFGFKAPIDVERRLAEMSYLGVGEAGVHQTQLSVSASLASQGVPDEQIVKLLLEATQHAVGLAGEHWNWKREEKSIAAMVASAKKKFPPKPARQPGNPAAVIQLIQGGKQEEPAPKEPPADEDLAPQLSGFPLNDLGNAMRLITHHKDALRYVVGMDWHVWDSRRYKSDVGLIGARTLAHETARAMLNQAFDLRAPTKEKAKTREAVIKFAIGSGNSNRISNMLEQAEPHLAAVADDLDRDPLLLNCENGTVDLKTSELRPHSREDLLTKICGASYDPDATCPIWERFLLEIFDGDAELVAFVQRAIGYSLTGLTNEQVIFILHGGGSNGKSVLIETIAAVLNEYVNRSPAETWISKSNNGPTNDIAALAGARFVSVVETEHEKQLAEALVKQATGGDAMTARFHYKEFFTFIPKFKLWFATNHKPRIRGSDFAIWRRILLLPFVVTFVDADKLTVGQRIKDPDLKYKLEAEFAGILAWMIRGCMAWQQGGLRPPEAVIHATESYQESQDNVSGFIRDACHVSRGIECASSLLYTAYQMWCEDNDEEPLANRAFGKNLEERGHPPATRTNKARPRKGIDLKYEFAEAAKVKMAFDNAAKGVDQ